MGSNKKAWRILVGSLLVLLFLTKGKLEAPPTAALGHDKSASASQR